MAFERVAFDCGGTVNSRHTHPKAVGTTASICVWGEEEKVVR